MTDEEKEIKEWIDERRKGSDLMCKLLDRNEQLKKENEQLREEISILLSCSNCAENKGGYICEKEYNDKCLAQKIEYIKELKEQIEEMKSFVKSMYEANKNDAYCREYLGTILNEWS